VRRLPLAALLACVLAAVVVAQTPTGSPGQSPVPVYVTPLAGGGPVINQAALLTPASGTGITINSAGSVRTQTYEVTIASTAFVCAAVTCDVTIATAPAKTVISYVLGSLTTVFACASTCTSSTLSLTLGDVVGTDSGFFTSFDADAATMLIGDSDAELGTKINRGNAVMGGYLGNMVAPHPLVLRLTSGTGNLGDGVTTFLSTGSLTVWITATVLP